MRVILNCVEYNYVRTLEILSNISNFINLMSTRKDLKLSLMQLPNWRYVFNITKIVRILLTMRVMLNFVEYNYVRTLKILSNISNFINLMSTRKDLKLSLMQLPNWRYVFNITKIVRILLTMRVILNFVEYNYVRTLKILSNISNFINLMSTRKDLKLSLMQLPNWRYVFNITKIVRILLTMRVILNFVEYNYVRTLEILSNISNFINLMSTRKDLKLSLMQLPNWRYVFNITKIVRILLTMRVILNFVEYNYVKTLKILSNISNFINLMSTRKDLKLSLMQFPNWRYVFNITKIVRILLIMRVMLNFVEYNYVKTLKILSNISNFINLMSTRKDLKLSLMQLPNWRYVFNITKIVRILLTMRVILNFVEYNYVKTQKILSNISNFINLMSTRKDLKLSLMQLPNWRYVFNITKIVRILLTMRVILNFVEYNYVKTLKILSNISNFINLMLTRKDLKLSLMQLPNWRYVFNITKIVRILLTMRVMLNFVEYNYVRTLKILSNISNFINLMSTRKDLKLSLMQLPNWRYVFNITKIVRILLTMRVILNFVEYNYVRTLKILSNISNFINLMSTRKDLKLSLMQLPNWRYVFNITKIVRILLTMRVILNFVEYNYVKTLKILSNISNFINLMSTRKDLKLSLMQLPNWRYVFNITKIVRMLLIMRVMLNFVEYNYVKTLKILSNISNFINLMSTRKDLKLSLMQFPNWRYVFNITKIVRILLTMRVILNFVEYNYVKTLKILSNISNFINLMSTRQYLKLSLMQLPNWRYVFNITKIVRILLTMRVILNFVEYNYVKTLKILSNISNFINLMSTRKDLKLSLMQLPNWRYVFNITKIVRILLTMRVILNFVEYNYVKTLKILSNISNFINLMSMRKDLKLSLMQLPNWRYVFNITRIVRILLTMRVILNFVEYNYVKTLKILSNISNFINLMSTRKDLKLSLMQLPNWRYVFNITKIVRILLTMGGDIELFRIQLCKNTKNS